MFKLWEFVHECDNYLCASRFMLIKKIIWLWCNCGIDWKIVLLYTLTHFYAWTMMTMTILLFWMKCYFHEHTMNMMWKVYSQIDDSKVEMTFSPNESMRYYDTMFVRVPSLFFLWTWT